MSLWRWLVVVLLLLGVAFASWWFRPWADYAPAVMTRLFHPEHRAYLFRHMEEVFPYRTLAASNEPFTLPEGAARPLPEFFLHEGQPVSTAAFLARTETLGLMVLHQGERVFEQYYQGASADDRFTSWSMAKSVVSSLVAVAAQQGHIASLDDPVSQYVAELDGQAWGAVPIRDLLRMASGIEFEEVYGRQFSDINKLFYRTFLLGQPVREQLRALPAAGPPGETFHYLSPNTQILAWVLERAVGEPLSDYASKQLWQPLGMQDEAIWNLDSSGVELGFCCLNASLRDYAKLGQLYLQQGQWRGQQLLPPGWVEAATRRPEPWLRAEAINGVRGYGYHLWLPPQPHGEYFMNGVWGQSIWVSERHGMVIAKTSVDPGFEARMAEVISFMRAVSAALDEP